MGGHGSPRWMRRLVLLSALLACSSPVAAALVVDPDRPAPVAAPLPAGWSSPQPTEVEISPGREKPTAPPPEGVLLMSWGGDYHSVLVIGPGTGTVRPAWVLTYHDENADLQVAYRAVAFRDPPGGIPSDGRDALMIGPMADAGQWSPDSFAVFASGDTRTQDDDPSH